MTGKIDHRYLAGVFAVLLCLCAAGVQSVHADGLYWERIPIQHTLPSHIFSALGLTHTTRLGHTRGIPRGRDDNFPDGLTDIIPYDTMNLLIVRGTVDAVASFRLRVLALDVPQPTWTVQFRLLDPKSQAVLGLLVEPGVLMDDSEEASVSDGVDKHCYRFHLYPAARGQVAVVLRTGVNTQTAGAQPVFAPSIVWLNPVSKTTSFQTPVVFNDLASDRAQVHNGLGTSSADGGSDYNVEITVTPNPASDPKPLTADTKPLGTDPKPLSTNVKPLSTNVKP